MKKIGIIILTIILSFTFISCSKVDNKINDKVKNKTDINNGYSTLLANTKWTFDDAEHTIYFGMPNLSSLADGTFANKKYSGTYKIYEDEYANEIIDKFEACDQSIKDEFWNNVKDKDNFHTFGLVMFINDNKNTRFEYFACLDNNQMILCDYKTTYVYEKAESNQDVLVKELKVTQETANDILERITLMLTADCYNIVNISKNPKYGYIVEVDVLSSDKYFIYLGEEYDIMLITKDKPESEGGEITFRQKE